MRLLYFLAMCTFLQSCERYEYYSIFEDEREVSSSILYDDSRIRVSFHIFNGSVSSLRFANLEKDLALKVELLSYVHTLIVNDTKYTPAIIEGDESGLITFLENQWSSIIISKEEMDSKPESLIESVIIEMIIDGELVTISKDFSVIKGSYSHLEALMNM